MARIDQCYFILTDSGESLWENEKCYNLEWEACKLLVVKVGDKFSFYDHEPDICTKVIYALSHVSNIIEIRQRKAIMNCCNLGVGHFLDILWSGI